MDLTQWFDKYDPHYCADPVTDPALRAALSSETEA